MAFTSPLKAIIGGDLMELRSKDIVEFTKLKKILTIPALISKYLLDYDLVSEKF